MAAISKAPSTSQVTARRCCPASQNPLAALKQRIALVHPLAQAAGWLMILKRFIGFPIGVAKSPVSSNFQECPWDRLAVAFDLSTLGRGRA